MSGSRGRSSKLEQAVKDESGGSGDDAWADDGWAAAVPGSGADSVEPPPGLEGQDLVLAPPDPAVVSRLKAEARSKEHLLTHEPKNPWCPTCQRAKMMKKPSLRKGPPRLLRGHPKFGDEVTMDHFVTRSAISRGYGGERLASPSSTRPRATLS